MRYNVDESEGSVAASIRLSDNEQMRKREQAEIHCLPGVGSQTMSLLPACDGISGVDSAIEIWR